MQGGLPLTSGCAARGVGRATGARRRQSFTDERFLAAFDSAPHFRCVRGAGHQLPTVLDRALFYERLRGDGLAPTQYDSQSH